MQEFIHQKKLQNPLKYTDNSIINNKAMPIPKGTISVMLNTKKKINLFAFKKRGKNDPSISEK